jgi:RHS repeat-associated protein
LGAGARPGATRIPFTIGDRVAAQVDAGSGNLLLTATVFTLPRRTTSAMSVGVAYNSVTRQGAAQFAGAVGAASSGWRLSLGPDVRLEHEGGYGAVVYHGENGLTGTFLPDGAGEYTPPAGFKMTLTGDATAGWELTDHTSGEKRIFDAGGRLTAIGDRVGNQADFGYTAAGALEEISTDVGPVNARSLTVGTSGSGSGRISEFTQTVIVTDPVSGSSTEQTRSVTLDYDGSGRLETITDSAGRTTEFAYSGGGNLAAVTAPGGATTLFGYDSDGRVRTVTQPTADPAVSGVTRFAYGDGETVVADPNTDQGLSVHDVPHTRYEHTTDGRLLVAKATDPTGNERTTTYTPFLDVATATDTAGTTTFGHDPAVNGGQSLTGITAATGAASSYAYGNTADSSRFLPSGGTDAQGNAATLTYNGAGQRLSAADANSATAAVTYNADGTVATSTTPSGAVTSYAYDTDGLLTSITPPAGNTLGARTFAWDGFGRLASRTDGRGITEAYRYDTLDRVLEVDYSDSTPSVEYIYDPAGRVATRTDASGVTTYTYDPLGRLASRVHTAGGMVSYGYDRAGNLASETDTSGTTSYSYDERNLLTRVTLTGGQHIDFGYDPDGRRTDTWFATTAAHTVFGAHTHTDYDASGRITRVWSARSSNDADRVSDLSYSYAAPGTGSCASAPPVGQDTALRWAQTDNRTGVTTSFCYDAANRLVSANTPGGDSWTYTYDSDGNRTQTTKNGTAVQTQTVNTADQLTDPGYSYDAAGNLTADNATADVLTYNGAGQMTSRADGVDTYSYSYAGTDQTELITQSLPSGGTRAYSYGRAGATGLPVIETLTVPAGTSRVTHDPTGSPLAIRTYAGSTHYYLLDGLGSVIGLAETGGTVTALYSYDPWGQVTQATSPIGSAIVTINPYRYAGGTHDPGSAYTHFGQRWYDPVTGRFSQQDSLETLADPTRANRYEYAASNPTNFVDPTGLSPFGCGGAVYTLIGGTLVFGAGVATLLLTPTRAEFAPLTIAAGVALLGTGLTVIGLALQTIDACL